MNLSKGVAAGVVVLMLVGVLSSPNRLYASDQSRAKELIQQTCVQCHRLEGKAESRFKLHAPDLIWAGSKYQRSWLIRWLTGKGAPLYAKRYLWDMTSVPRQHLKVTDAEANAIVDYFAEHNKDPRVTVGAFDVSKVTKFDVAFGGMPIRPMLASAATRSRRTASSSVALRVPRYRTPGNGTTWIGCTDSGRTHRTSPYTMENFWPMLRMRNCGR